MKKLFVLCLVCFCISPSYAQRGGWHVFTRGKKSATHTSQIKHKVKSAVAWTKRHKKSADGPRIQITNLPDKPLVKLGETGNTSSDILPARLLSGIESHQILFRGISTFPPVYAPLTFNTQEEVVFRGLQLYDLKSVQNILRNGLEYRKVSRKMEKKIYFSGTLRRAARFAVQYDSPKTALPVLVKFTVPDKERIYPSRYVFGWDYYCWLHNIPTTYIQDVVVLLEVNGTPGWYKATLENGQLILTPTPSRVFEDAELIEHDLGVYDDY